MINNATNGTLWIRGAFPDDKGNGAKKYFKVIFYITLYFVVQVEFQISNITFVPN